MASSARPTLPSLSSLLLPTPVMTYQSIHGSPTETHVRRIARPYRRSRKASISSSATSARTPSLSPPPPDSSNSSFSSHTSLRTPSPSPPPPSFSSEPSGAVPSAFTSTSTSTTFRLVPTTLAQADAILFVPPPSNPAMSSLSSVPSISRLARSSADDSASGASADKAAAGRALLLVGPAMNHLRGAKGVRTQLARGARVHPYKIVRNPTGGAKSQHRGTPTPLIPVRDVRATGFCD